MREDDRGRMNDEEKTQGRHFTDDIATAEPHLVSMMNDEIGRRQRFSDIFL